MYVPMKVHRIIPMYIQCDTDEKKNEKKCSIWQKIPSLNLWIGELLKTTIFIWHNIELPYLPIGELFFGLHF